MNWNVRSTACALAALAALTMGAASAQADTGSTPITTPVGQGGTVPTPPRADNVWKCC